MSTEEFLVELDDGMLEFFRDIAEVLVTRFGVSPEEAVARVNAVYEGAKIEPYPDLMCHEFPEFWAYRLYFEPKGWRTPDGDPEEDLSGWNVRPAPPKGSRFWTVSDRPGA
ncbi:hypothetical protein ACFXDH_36645 [Streptomyces sp. NPDC059467]|uniref:hypothetical protein n=1 Tax=Streptomyces sp. NPDC059467 TaxID=3346844 RepID=UPI0036939224